MNEPKQVGKGILYSLVVIFALMFAGSLLISLLLTFTSLTESSFSWLITAISFITLFIGGFIAGGKSKEKGWLSGGLTALCFSLTVLLFQYLGFGEAFNLKQAPLSFRLFGSQHAGRGFRGQSAGEPCIKAAKRERMSAPFSQCPQASFVIHIRNKCSFLKQ